MIRVNSQSFSLSSTLDRKGKNYETAQVVPKSQTFPSQTLPILHNQHSNQQRPGQGPNSPSKYQSSRIVGERDYEGDESLLLHYVTERILASVLPPRRSSSARAMLTHSPRAGAAGGDIVAESAVVEAADDHERELIVMLEQKHGKNYRLFDLESCIATVTLEKLCELCKRIDSWLGNSREKVVVLLDRGDRQRLGAAIAAYLEYQRLCGSNFPSRATTPISGRQSVEDLQAQTTIAKKWLNLDIYSMKKFLADVVGPQRVPSHKRYLQYFSGLLSGSIKINAAPLFLKYVSMESPPSWLYYDAQSPNSGEWRCFIKVYESLHCCFTSEVYVVPITTRNFVIQIGNLRLRGDIMIRCYQLVSSPANAGAFDRELLFSVQFHTCAAGDRTLVFHRKDLDYACEDPRFPEDHKLSIQFSNGADKGYVFQSPLVRTEQQTAITQWDSLLDVNTEVARSWPNKQHLHGPLDGSIYATILKSPRSTARTSLAVVATPNVILSPPPTELLRGVPSLIPYAKSSHLSGSTQSLQIYPTSKYSSAHDRQYLSPQSVVEFRSGCLTPTPFNESSRHVYSPSAASTDNDSVVHFQRAFSTPPQELGRDRSINQSSTASTINQQQHHRYQHLQQSPRQFVQEFRLGEEFERPQPSTGEGSRGGVLIKSGGQIGKSGNGSGQVVDGGVPKLGGNARDSSLTLSIDSGISSGGHQRQQVQRTRELIASSVSPSSFKSSQQDDQQQQHQELDDILSDMLSNVKDIPDIGRNINRSNSYYASPANTSSREHHRLGQHSQSRSSLPAQPTYHQSGRQPRSSYAYEDAYNTVKRTPSYSSSVVTDNQSIISKSSTVSSSHHPHTYLTGENYETASTTTTLTPPPSEYGGRETPSNHPYSSQRPLSRDQASSSNLYISNVERQSNQALSHPQAGYHQVRHQSQQQPNNTRSSTTTIRTTTTNEHTMDLQQQQRRDNYRAAELSREQSPGSQSVVDHHQEQNSRQQTVVYAEPQRQHTVELISATSEEDEESGQQQGIPYHAREYAQPFTYGDIAAAAAATANNSGEKSGSKGTGMLKMQSGLSSPSLVRKQIGATQHKNVPIRNEFEEMLRMRREKVENSEKYSISDRNGPENSHSGNNGHLGDNYKVSGSGGFSFDDKWASSGKLNKNGQQNSPGSVTIKTVTTTTTTRDPVGPVTANGYVHRSYEPVKRSNTMDTYNRSLSSDGASWLQKQQQRLRAKKEQLSRGSEEDYYGRTTYQENYATTSRPGRGRLNASKRYDGYTSDTTFGDEVDFRRQYAQTPPPVRNNYYNEPNRNYNTISTVTTTTKTLNNKERPFVAVRRAHEQSKQGYNMREESYSSSYNGELSPSLSSRPETPAFPLTPRTPYHYGRASPALPPKSPTTQRKDLHTGQHIHHVVNQNDSMSCYTSRRNSLNSNANSEPQDVAAHHVKFVRDSSKFWYKPNITREEASSLLRHAPPGTFIVRDSKSFTNAFGLVLKVSHPPPNAAKVPPGDELVRHFLVEPTTRGVRLKGCANEPVFTSLSALVYQHSITPLALPCRLLIPDRDIQEQYDVRQYTELSQQRQLFNQGAACNVMFLCAVETESLTGPEAVKRAVSILFAKRPLPIPTEVHFKVTNQGITLTDNTRQLFFRKHYPSSQISFIAVDPDNRHWSTPVIGRDVPVVNNRVFAFVARRAPSSSDNICHIFCELEQAQPASAIVSFANNAILQITGNGSVPASPQIL